MPVSVFACFWETAFGLASRADFGRLGGGFGCSPHSRVAAFTRLSGSVSDVPSVLLRKYVQVRCLVARSRYFGLSTRGDPVASQMCRPPLMALLLAPALAPLGNFFSSRTLPPPSTV